MDKHSLEALGIVSISLVFCDISLSIPLIFPSIPLVFLSVRSSGLNIQIKA